MRILSILISSFLFLSLNGQKGNINTVRWHNDETAGANIPSGNYSYDKKGKIYYFISNDAENIYLEMKISDLVAQNRILKQGLTLWINMDNKQEKNLGVRFPIGSQNSGNRNTPKLPDDNLNTEASLAIPLSMATTIDLIGFLSEAERHFPAENADTFSGSVIYDKGNLFYKMVMPIYKLPVRNSKDRKGAMPFSLGIEYGSTTVKPSISPVLIWIKSIKLATGK